MAKKNMDDVKQLIDMGKEKGFLTFDEVNDMLPPDIATDQIDDVMGMFGDMDIEIVDSAQKVKIPKMKTDLEEDEESEGESEEIEFEAGLHRPNQRSCPHVSARNGFGFPAHQRWRGGNRQAHRRWRAGCCRSHT